MQTAAPITTEDLADQVGHDVGCPPNGYLGQGYGIDLRDMLHTPMAAARADDVIAKIRSDVPLASRLGPGDINLFMYDAGIDKKVLVIEVAGSLVPIPGDRL